jgi:hypothetical protein
LFEIDGVHPNWMRHKRFTMRAFGKIIGENFLQRQVKLTVCNKTQVGYSLRSFLPEI